MKRDRLKQYKAITIVTVVMAVLLVIVAVILNQPEKIDDGFFVSDDTKLVLTLNERQAAYEESEYEPDITRVVYYYSGDKITKVRIFYEYDSDEEARIANDNVTLTNKPWAYAKNLNGRFIIFELPSSQCEDLTTEHVRGIID